MKNLIVNEKTGIALGVVMALITTLCAVAYLTGRIEQRVISVESGVESLAERMVGIESLLMRGCPNCSVSMKE